MILSAAPAALVIALCGLAAYGLAAWRQQQRPRLEVGALIVGWLLHAALLVVDVVGS